MVTDLVVDVAYITVLKRLFNVSDPVNARLDTSTQPPFASLGARRLRVLDAGRRRARTVTL